MEDACRIVLQDFSQDRIKQAIQLFKENGIGTVGRWRTLADSQKTRYASSVTTLLDKAVSPSNLSFEGKVQALLDLVTITAPPDSV